MKISTCYDQGNLWNINVAILQTLEFNHEHEYGLIWVGTYWLGELYNGEHPCDPAMVFKDQGNHPKCPMAAGKAPSPKMG